MRPSLLVCLALAVSGCHDEQPLIADAAAPAASLSLEGGAAPDTVATADGGGAVASADATFRFRDTATAVPALDAVALTADLGGGLPDAPVAPRDAAATIDAPAPPDAAPDLVRDSAPDLTPEVPGVCSGAANGTACPDGHCCGGVCVSSRSVNSCGTACSPCPARAGAFVGCDGQRCTYGCYAGYGDCDGNTANGCETSTTQSAQHCGGCGKACQPAHTINGRCAGGSCTYDTCALGWRDCDGQAANGCEAQPDGGLCR